jgi:hypothetical protein
MVSAAVTLTNRQGFRVHAPAMSPVAQCVTAEISDVPAQGAWDSEFTPRQKELLRATLATVGPASKPIAALFYRRLVELDPSLRRQLKGRLKAQGREFMAVLKLGLVSLDDPAGMERTLQHFKSRRRRRAMQAGHCLTLSRALIWAFEQSLEARFTREARQAWAALLAKTSRTMADWGPRSSVYGRLWLTAV